jgi:uncharacterized phage infection (PIP) family protein YhgE
MRRVIPIMPVVLIALGLALTPGANAQPKVKDPVMMDQLNMKFSQVAEALNQISARLGAMEAELARLKQLETEIRNAQNAVKTADDKQSQFATGATRDLIDLKRDLAQIRSDLVSVSNDVRRGMTAQSPVPAGPAVQSAPAPEGYITEVSDNEVTINLGSAAGLREGMRFEVFKAGDASKTRIGTITIKQILDANASKAEITFKSPTIKFEFSDGVRPIQ